MRTDQQAQATPPDQGAEAMAQGGGMPGGTMTVDGMSGGVPGGENPGMAVPGGTATGAVAGGPDMGQPHFSEQLPGSAPYQGMAAMPGGQPVAGYYVMGDRQGDAGAPPVGTMAAPQGGYAVAPGGYAVMPNGQLVQQPGQPVQPMQFVQPGQPVQPALYAPQGQYVQQVPGAMYAPDMAAQAQAVQSAAAEKGKTQYGELYGMIQEAAEGNPDVSKFLDFFTTTGTDFWKGAAVGAGLTLLLTNDTVKSAIVGGFSSIFGALGKSAEEMEAEEDRKAEERAAREAK